MKIWHWALIGAGAWFMLRKKTAAAANVPTVEGPPPVPAASVEPEELLDVLRTKLDPILKHKVLSFNSGDVVIESWAGATKLGSNSFPSLQAATDWALSLPFSKAPAVVNWKMA